MRFQIGSIRNLVGGGYTPDSENGLKDTRQKVEVQANDLDSD